jgi:hypothetical protein
VEKNLLRSKRRFIAPQKISLAADHSERFANTFAHSLFRNGVKTAVSGLAIAFTVDETGHKVTLGANPLPVGENKTTFTLNAAGQAIATPGSAKVYAGKVTAVDTITRQVTVSIPAAAMRTANTEIVEVSQDHIGRFKLGDNVNLRRTEKGPVIESTGSITTTTPAIKRST